MTDVETKLWYQLRDRRFYGVKFRRQHPIKGFIVDFVSLEHNLIIELDGGQHSMEKSRDAMRTTVLESEGYKVIRFWNNEIIENMNGVLYTIAEALSEEYELQVTPHLPRFALLPLPAPIKVGGARGLVLHI